VTEVRVAHLPDSKEYKVPEIPGHVSPDVTLGYRAKEFKPLSEFPNHGGEYWLFGGWYPPDGSKELEVGYNFRGKDLKLMGVYDLKLTMDSFTKMVKEKSDKNIGRYKWWKDLVDVIVSQHKMLVDLEK
jgi:hypothetical protein